MRRTEKGTPTLSWCMIVRNSESTLEATLKSIRERTPQAEIVIVDTMSSDRSPEIAKKYADVWVEWRGPNGDWDREMPWFSDAAAARQMSFDLASGRWRAWIDSDDRLPGPEEAEQLLKLNARWEPKAKNVVKAESKPEGLDDILLKLEKMHPDADCVWAPYLYAKDEHGQAFTWQVRERIIKWSTPAKWHWAEKAHEILVPVDGYTPKMRIEFAHLLFIHERKFSQESNDYSTKRHFDVLHKQYLAGDMTTRRCLYLAAYSRTLCPEREREFIMAAHQAATTPSDRYRAMNLLGQMFVRQGFFTDALEAYAAATHLRPDLADAWFQGGESWKSCDDFLRAADWIEKGLACQSGLAESDVTPRHHYVRYPTLLSEIYEKLADIHKKAGFHDVAQSFLFKGVKVMEKVKDSPSIGQDRKEAEVRLFRIHNSYLAQSNAIAIKNLCEYLINNDEPKKALEITSRVPWNLQDHPLIVDLQKRLAPVKRHISDPAAYNDFYAKEMETGAVFSPDAWMEPKSALLRVHWAANWINRHMPRATVLDVGCFDGIIGIPLLKLCPGIKYVGLDIYDKAVAKFNERIAQNGFGDRATIVQISKIEDIQKSSVAQLFDVALWFEVIEHVPDPVATLTEISSYVRPGGQVFVTTPWGSYDAGHPPQYTDHGTPRDSRGHVRVLTARDTVEVFDDCGIATEDLTKFEVPVDGLGDGLHIQGTVKPVSDGKGQTPATFVVPGALWDWNGRSVDQKGMGASEKSIVQIAGALATSYRRVEVYGPVPNEDVYKGVRYWPKEQLRHVNFGKLIVSRSPGYAQVLDKILDRKLPKILWLQDAYYPDLNEKVAADYEKIVVVSEWHMKAMHEYHQVPFDKMEVIYNPIDARLYDIADKPKRKSDHFVYCSSPDRGLIPLLRMWPKILQQLPNATLDIFYGWKGCEKLGLGNDAAWNKRYMTARREFEKLRYQKGVVVRDMVDPVTLSRVFMSAGVWAYPVTNFNETCCTAAIEARAAGCIPVTRPIAGLAETGKCDEGYLVDYPDGDIFVDLFVLACVQAANKSEDVRQKMSEDVIEHFSVGKSLTIWERLLQ